MQRQASSPDWHLLETAQATVRLDVDPATGLSQEEARQRLTHYGSNRLQPGKSRTVFSILLGQFSDFMILVLVGAAILSGIIGDLTDTFIILLILCINAIIGATQEIKAEKAMSALQALSTPGAIVRRNAIDTSVAAVELVPGDIVILDTGVQVPADLRLLETRSLAIDESTLTGESIPAGKQTAALAGKTGISLGDRSNMAWQGTLVTHGRGIGVVVATGMLTELGQIANLVKNTVDTATPLQRRLQIFSRRLALGILAVCILIFLSGIMRGEPALLMLLTSVSLAVAAIPESLPAVVTIALAFGASRLARLQALMRNLRSVETLGSVTWICSDKTGTLTQNRMHVEKLFPAAASPLARDRMLAAMALCNDAVMKDGELSGDPTETALLLAVSEHCGSVSDIRSAQPRLAELPFASERMRMTTFHADSDDIIAFTKGAPEAVVSRCSRQFDSPEQAWNPEVTMQEAAVLAAEGMRVLALACRHWPAVPAFLEPDMVESEMQFLGLLALIDPPREEAATAIATCRQASITPVMITGDHPSTALAIARRLGIAGTEDLLITGEELRRLSDAALAERIGKLRVFARMDPAQKIRIVNALQDTGEFVAMTGDGVNDAPALKKADIGIAMGRNGTDVAREASDMILMDDNFATIVSAVAGGRRIYDNIRRFIRYILATNLAEVLLIFLAPFLGLPLPLLPVQILWINLVTDGLPGLALTAEKPEPDIMQRRPRPARETLFAGGLWQHLLWVGLLMSGLVLWVQQYALDNGAANWQTQVFTTMTFVQLANVMAIRSERSSTFVIGFTSNRPLLFSVVLTLVLQLALIYVPSLNDAFSTMPLSPGELLLCCVPAVLAFIAVETEKWMIRSGWLYSRMAPPHTERSHD